MELLDRYLQAIKRFLPLGHQEDIIKELSDNLLSRIEDKESELGRQLQEFELESIIKSHGHPILVAARYQPQQYLIGPMVAPLYWFILKIAVAMAIAVYGIVNTVLMALGTPTLQGAIQIILGVPRVAWITAAWVTFSFVAIEIAVTKYNVKLNWFENWSPRSLPRLEKDQQKHRCHPMVEFLGAVFLVLWMLIVPYHPFLVFGPGAYYLQSQPIQAAPIWYSLYWPFMALLFASMIVKAAYLFSFSWSWPKKFIDLIFRMLGLLLLSLLIEAHEFVILSGTATGDITHLQDSIAKLNYGILIGLRIALAIAAVNILWEGGRILYESYRGRSSYQALRL